MFSFFPSFQFFLRYFIEDRFVEIDMAALNQDPPSWLVEDEKRAAVGSYSNEPRSPNTRAQAVQSGSVGSVEGRRRLSLEEEGKARMLFFAVKGITLILCILMFITACMHLEEVSSVTSSGQIFVATYMIFFSVLLASFEIAQSRQIVWLDHMLRRNFGFLFSAVGKALFIIFVAFLCLGLDGQSDMPIIVGITVAAFGIGQVALYLQHPEWFDYIPSGYEFPVEQDTIESDLNRV